MKYYVILGLAALTACSEQQSKTLVSEPAKAHGYIAPAAPDLASPSRFEAKNIAKAREAILAEPKVVSVFFDDTLAVEWHVAVKDDGTSRHGYAEYICLLLKDADAHDGETDVRIIDAAKITEFQDAYRDYSLGWVHCADGARLD